MKSFDVGLHMNITKQEEWLRSNNNSSLFVCLWLDVAQLEQWSNSVHDPSNGDGVMSSFECATLF